MSAAFGAGCIADLGNPRLTAILKAVRQDRTLPVALRCNVETIYRYQNPGHADDTPEGELFNGKRDLDILHMLGLVPGDARPAIDIFRRLLEKIPQARGICAYETTTSSTWQGCVQAGSGDYEKGHALGIEAIFPPRDPGEMAKAKRESAAAIYQAQPLRIRPHHLLCMSCFHGGKESRHAGLSALDRRGNCCSDARPLRNSPETDAGVARLHFTFINLRKPGLLNKVWLKGGMNR